jgi:hypothetical protein
VSGLLAAVAASVALLAGCSGEVALAPEAFEPIEARALRQRYAQLTGIDRLRRFDAGVAVRGRVDAITDHGEEGGGPTVLVSGAVSLRFGQAESARALGVGAPVAAICRVSGMADQVLFLDRCARRVDPAPPQPR